MFNGNRRSLVFESECADTRHSSTQTLLNFSFQENQNQFDNDSVNTDNSNGITDGWKKVTSIYVLEQKITTKLKKKINGQSRSLGCFGNYRYDRKKMKLLFTDNLKLIYNSKSYEYIPLNGVYQVSKSAEAFTDALNYRKGTFGKRILLPLNEPISTSKDVNLVEENTNKTCFSLSSLETDNTFQSQKIKNVSSSASLSDLRIGVDFPFTMMKKSLNKHQFPKSKSADIKGKNPYTTIFDQFKEMFFDELVPRDQLSKNIYCNSTVYSQFKCTHLLSSVQLKSMMQEKKCQESSQFSKISDHLNGSGTSQTNSNVSSHDITSTLKTKGFQMSKKGNKSVFINEMSKNLNSKYNNYNIILQPDINCKQQSNALTEEVLPEIFGTKIKANPSIHRWL